MRDLLEKIEKRLKARSGGCLMILGIDNMRLINIDQGWETGNNVLKLMNRSITQTLGENRQIYQVNGDCFVFGVPENKREDVQAIYQKISQGMGGNCTISGGAVFYEDCGGKSGEEVMEYAMFAIERAKNSGKNMLVFYSRKDYEEWLGFARLEERMLNDIANDFRGFSVCYQPQISTSDYSLYGAEALLRYTTRDGTPVSPAEMIPILEKNRTICVVGLRVLKTALRQCRDWRERYFPDFHVSVNLSCVQLEDPGIVEDVRAALRESGLPGSALTLEITETQELDDCEGLENVIAAWHEDGISLSLDDFGTGYSNIGHMAALHFDEIKVDKSLTDMKNIHGSIIKTLIKASDSRHIRVCCEGVETEEILASLEKIGPELLQGFLFSRPRWPGEFEEAYFMQGTDSYNERLRNNRKLMRQRRIRRENKSGDSIFGGEQMRELFHAAMSKNMAYAVADFHTGNIYINGTIWASGKPEQELLPELRRLADTERSYMNPETQKLLDGLFDDAFMKELEKNREYEKTFCYQRKVSETWEWVELHLEVFEGCITKTRYLLLTIKNVNDEKNREIRLCQKAMRDSLTQVYTYEAFKQCVEEYMGCRSGEPEGTLILFDIDNFKGINDRYGHQVGDIILKFVADTIKATFRKDDIIGRLGGDEFAVFVPELTDRDILDARMGKLYDAFQTKSEIPFTLSAGLMKVCGEAFDFAECRSRTDMALYASKRNGKNQYQYVRET